jgi:signal transduction histidine kinase
MTLDSAIQSTLLCQVARELASTRDLEDMLSQVLRMTMEALGAEHGTIFLLDPAGRITRRIPADPDINPRAADHATAPVMRQGLALAQWALRHRQAVLIPDVHAGGHRLPLPDGLEEIEEVGSALAAPLIHREHANGVLTLSHSQRGFFAQPHAALAEVVAQQAAVAVESARLQTEARQGRSAALAGLISELPEPILLVDGAGRLAFANQAAEDALGIRELERPLADLNRQEKVQGLIAQATASGRLQRMEIEWQDKRLFEASLAPVANLGVVICLHDITHLKQLDDTKSQLLTIASHDLKNPLALIRGFAQLLLAEEGLSSEGQRCVQGVLSGVEKMQALIHNLLDIEQIGAGLWSGEERSEVGPIISGVVRDLEPRTAEKGQSLTVGLPMGLPPVQVDPLRLEHAVRNLVDNAIKYTQSGGHIHIDVRAHHAGVTVRVQDDGPGIPKAAQSQLFERFFRVSSPATTGKEGSGLGLSIVRAIVEDCGGQIGVESEEGHGSTFWFWLPEAPMLSESPAAPRARLTELQPRRR